MNYVKFLRKPLSLCITVSLNYTIVSLRVIGDYSSGLFRHQTKTLCLPQKVYQLRQEKDVVNVDGNGASYDDRL